MRLQCMTAGQEPGWSGKKWLAFIAISGPDLDAVMDSTLCRLYQADLLKPSIGGSMSDVRHHLARRASAELIGTAMLLSAVVGSGIAAERLAAGNSGLALLANSIATAGALVALILTFGPISGAHFNPVVTLGDAWRKGTPWPEVPVYLTAQIAGAFVGVGAANLILVEFKIGPTKANDGAKDE